MQKSARNSRKSGMKGKREKGRTWRRRKKGRRKGEQIGLQRTKIEKLIKMKEIFDSSSTDTAPSILLCLKMFGLYYQLKTRQNSI